MTPKTPGVLKHAFLYILYLERLHNSSASTCSKKTKVTFCLINYFPKLVSTHLWVESTILHVMIEGDFNEDKM
jgi:hypothetical protein